MDFNNYRKVVHASIWFGKKIALSQVIKEAYHKGYWSDAGGKVEKNEKPMDAIVREVYEETGLDIDWSAFDLIDCFIYPERQIKSFLFEVKLPLSDFSDIKNMEPKKQSNWQLFTIEEALKLKLMPSVKFYLNGLLV